MHIAFFNPQGNFDQQDSYMAEHPDFGGQLIYVKEVAMAMVDQGHKVDIITRQIIDNDWPEFSEQIAHYTEYEDGLRIVRIACGGPNFLTKELLWPHLDEFIDNTLNFYKDELPDFTTAHYGDGGYCAVRFLSLTGIGFTLTGHSLGAQKLDKLGTTAQNYEDMEERFKFSKRIAAERAAMSLASRIITSTGQERDEQYTHPLYQGAVDVTQAGKFSVIPPGVNTHIFTTEKGPHDEVLATNLDLQFPAGDRQYVVVSSRLDVKKNIIGVVKAFALSAELREKADLVLCIRGIDEPERDIVNLPDTDQAVLRELLNEIEASNLAENIQYLNLQSQRDLAAAYRYFGERGSVFALTAFYEPFGLAPIEAAACGLACVATKNGGPSEIFANGSGVLVDPYSAEDIARGLVDALNRQAYLATASRAYVLENYTWSQTAKNYLQAISESDSGQGEKSTISLEDGVHLIKTYLAEQSKA